VSLKHSPIPWTLVTDGNSSGHSWLEIQDAKDKCVEVFSMTAQSREDATHVVNCVNMHYKLLDCIKELKNECYAWKAAELKVTQDYDVESPEYELFENYKEGIEDNINYILGDTK